MNALTIGNLARTGLLLLLVVTTFQQWSNPSFTRLRSFDKFSLVPSWTFFAPNPATRDHTPLHRSIYADGSIGEWRETAPSGHRPFLQNFWHPSRRLSKALIDWANELLPQIRSSDERAIESSSAYTMLRRYVERVVRESGEENVVAVQFLLAIHGGFDEEPEPSIAFVSRYHRIDDQAGEAQRGASRE